jgi:hypothetical protein
MRINPYGHHNRSIFKGFLLWYECVFPEFRKYDAPHCPVEDTEEQDTNSHKAIPFNSSDQCPI